MSDDHLPVEQPPEGQFLLYQTEDGETRVECRFAGESIWLSQAVMAKLFQVTVPTINEHLKNLRKKGEIEPRRTIRKFRIVRQEGSRPKVVDEHFERTLDELKRIEKRKKRNDGADAAD